jgi:capsular polysaccharide biosynthesis protein/Mrp family chromosome partitioning ATPase
MMIQTELAAHGEPDRPDRPTTDWIGEAPPSHGLGLYLEVIRARLGLVVMIVVYAVAIAVLFVTQSAKVYEAEADLLVTPIPGANESLFGLGLVSESGDPTRDAETLSKVITTPPIAERVRERLGLEQSAAALLEDVRAEPVAQSSIVTITAKAGDPELSARIANEFGRAAVAVRTARMHNLLDSLIPQLRKQLEETPVAQIRNREELGAQVRELETFRLLPDPTLHLETEATAPQSPVAPRPVLSVAAAFLAGLVLSFGLVLGLHVVNPRIEREEDLRRYRIPVLGRIPLVGRRRLFRKRAALRPEQLTPAAGDAFFRLAGSLAARTDDGDRSIMLTGASPDDGKTTTSINLAAALATMRNRVVLIEADWRKPKLASTLGVDPPHGLSDVLVKRVPLTEALVDADGLPGGVEILDSGPPLMPRAIADAESDEVVAGLLHDVNEPMVMPVSPKSADWLLGQAERRADWVIVDGATLNHTPDSLPIAKRVASVFVVIRLHKTRARDLADLAELLTQQRIVPAGFIIVGSRERSVYR